MPLTLFLAVLLHGSFLGLTDDEAYYWVLAQRPALGYAYHPPAVAWLIALFETVLSPFTNGPSAFLVRLPAASCAAITLALGLAWMEKTGAAPTRLGKGAIAMLSLAGLFGLSWMMVPDLPLLVGWTTAFYATWQICFAESDHRGRYFALAAGIGLALLSKYSAVLGAVSSALALLFWAPRARKIKGWGSLLAGSILAAIPILAWNASHEWASILYQIRDRHEGGSLSLLRYGRFWAAQVALAGPALLAFGAWLLFKGRERPYRYALLWAAPAAAVFCVQPLWADFKPHWAFIAWWPLAMALGWAWSTGKVRSWGLFQAGHGFVVLAFIVLSCHLPIGSWIMARASAKPLDPRLDVTNDLYGWAELGDYLETLLGRDAWKLPVIGSRYQTASQASFGVGRRGTVTLLPRDLKARDEWPSVDASEGEGPDWPRLKAPVLFVADNRYDGGPEFRDARCDKMGRMTKERWGYPAKWIDVWRCEPAVERP